MKVTAEELAAYRATARDRRERAQQELARRRARAQESARQAARLLKEQFGATRVVLFGSLARREEEAFTLWSDVDLAVWGLRPEETFRAVQAVLGLDAEIAINLVDIEVCRPALRAALEDEGREL